MCSVFGLIDFKNHLTRKEKRKLLNALAVACEERGTDASGVSYCTNGRLCTYKKPVPARYMHFDFPEDVKVVLGHTRFTTQGEAAYNPNNHPFPGLAGKKNFSLAHNGILTNDRVLKRTWDLPKTKIMTDSYVAVQLLEQMGSVDTASLKTLAELLEGSFVLTVLTEDNVLYLVRGNNPCSVYYFPDKDCFLYASTSKLLDSALKQVTFMGMPQKVSFELGEIIAFTEDRAIERSTFDTRKIRDPWYGYRNWWAETTPEEDPYLQEVRELASCFGFTDKQVDSLLQDGMTLDEIADVLYGEMDLWR